jgi:hypothetical protein
VIQAATIDSSGGIRKNHLFSTLFLSAFNLNAVGSTTTTDEGKKKERNHRTVLAHSFVSYFFVI